MRVLVVGAGFSGLTLAHYLEKAGAEVEIWEKLDRCGGLLNSQRKSDALVEAAANGLINSEKLEKLTEELSLSILPAKKASRKRYFYRDGKLRKWPLSFLESCSFLSGYLKKKSPKGNESLADWAERNFGKAALEYLIEPVCFGIFATPAKQLQARLVYDYFFRIRTASPKDSPRGLVSFSEGMGQLILALEESLQARGARIQKGVTAGADIFKRNFDACVISTSAQVAADLLQDKAEEAAAKLRKVKYQSIWSVSLGFAERPNCTGFGCLFPKAENFNSLGVLFPNDIFENRGGVWQENWILSSAEIDESQVLPKVLQDRQRLFTPSEPDWVKSHYWPMGIPVYDEAVAAIADLRLPRGVFLHGNYLGRMGLAKILERSATLSEEIMVGHA